jgi:hypothetical protein
VDGKTPKACYKPKDRVDEISLKHDLYYTEHTNQRERIVGDNIMLEELREIEQPTCRECFERAIITPLLKLKRNIATLCFYIIDRFSNNTVRI